MTKEEFLELQYHDEVLWTDPDYDLCSRVLTIRTAKLVGDIAVIEDISGDVVECFLNELS